MRFFTCVMMVLMMAGLARGQAVYQYAADATTADGKPMRVWLWVPAKAERLRGVIVAGNATSAEAMFCDAAATRRVCEEEKLGIVYMNPHVDAMFDIKERKADEALLKALEVIAEKSGYHEVKVAPLFFMGHSVSTVFASHAAARWRERCFGMMSHKGGVVVNEETTKGFVGVPIFASKGEYEEFGPAGGLRENEDRTTAAKVMRETLVGLRKRGEEYLVSMLVEPGATHFPWAKNAEEVHALFLKKAAQARIPEWDVDAREPVICKVVDAKRATELDGLWYLDGEMAKAVMNFGLPMKTKKQQLVTFAEVKTGKAILPGHDLRLRFNPAWVSADEFEVAGMFLEEPTKKYPPIEGKLGRAEGDVQFMVYGGQVEQTAAKRFRVMFHPRRKFEMTILAYHPGDATYRHAEQAAILRLARLKGGKAQAISFEKIEGLEVGRPVQLKATSDAGLPVRFYVESGPAVIEDGQLKVAEMPARVKGPMEVTVVTYQFGSAVEPLVQTAEDVRQTVMVGK